jgi:hypothetical protein
MDIPANRARMEFALEGTPCPVIAVNGEERLNQGFYFEIDIQVTLDRQVQKFVGHRGQLKFTGIDGERRLIAGLVESAEDMGFDTEQKAKRIVLGFMPRYRILEQERGPALWLGLDFQGLARPCSTSRVCTTSGSWVSSSPNHTPPAPGSCAPPRRPAPS